MPITRFTVDEPMSQMKNVVRDRIVLRIIIRKLVPLVHVTLPDRHIDTHTHKRAQYVAATKDYDASLKCTG